jgi:hypothetical protein
MVPVNDLAARKWLAFFVRLRCSLPRCRRYIRHLLGLLVPQWFFFAILLCIASSSDGHASKQPLPFSRH